MTYTRKNKGVCSLSTEVTLTDDGVIESVTVVGGCNGNLKGISALLTGLRAEDAIRRLKGLTCGSKHTSCPDQIALALEEALAEAAQAEPQPEIRLYGDRKTDYEHVVRVMAAAQRAGIAKLAFVTKPRD